MPEVMRRLGHYGHYPAWVEEGRPGPFWDRLSPRAQAGAVRLPALHIGGWYDGMLSGTLAAYRDFAMRQGAGPQRLVIGPWVHIPWAEKVGEIDFGGDAVNRIDELQLRWFDHWLKGVDTGLLDAALVRLFEMGGTWRDFPSWPDPIKTAFHLTSAGRAGLDPPDGCLVEPPPSPAEHLIVY